MNLRLLQVISDVFNACVFTQEVTSNASSLGGCVRAISAYNSQVAAAPAAAGEKDPAGDDDVAEWQFERVVGHKTRDGLVLRAVPNSDAKTIYDSLVQRYKKLENDLISVQLG